MKNIFAIHTNNYHGFSFEQALDGISRAGFKYVELSAVKNWTEHVMAYMSDDELNDIKELMKKYELSAITLSGHCDLFDEQRLDDFRNNIELAANMGCKYIISSTGEAHFGEKEEVNDDVLVENLKTLIPSLEKHNMILGLELHGVYCKGEDMGRVTRLVGSPRIGVNYDTANVVYFGGTSPIDDIKTCVDQVVHVHLKDSCGEKGVWNFPGTGQGKLPLKEFMEYMDAHDYEGPYSIEVEYTEDYTMRDKDQPGDIDVADKAMADSFAYLHALGRV